MGTWETVIFSQRRYCICHTCIFFGGRNKEVVFNQVGCRNWRDAHEKFTKHERSHAHVDATLDFACYCTRTFINEKLSAETSWLEGERHMQVEQNRSTMKYLTVVTIFLENRDLHSRDIKKICLLVSGTREISLQLQSSSPNTIKQWQVICQMSNRKELKEKRVANRNKRRRPRVEGEIVTFTSEESENKIIDIVGNDVMEKVLKEFKATVYFSIAMHCTTDSSNKDQPSIIIRYLSKNLDITELLLCVERVKHSSAEGLFNKVKDCFERLDIQFEYAVGQSYDRAFVMKEICNGVNTNVQRVAPQCLFIWTFDHVLNLLSKRKSALQNLIYSSLQKWFLALLEFKIF